MPRKIDEAKLFAAVIRNWMTHGYARCTTKGLAQNSGVNEATLFRRYGSKAGLFAHAIDHQLTDTPLGKLCISDDLNADLMALGNAYFKTYEAHGDVLFRALQDLPPHPEVRGAASSLLRNVQSMGNLMQHHQRLGHLRAEHPMLALTAFIGPIATFLMFERSGLSPEVPPFSIEMHVAGFTTGRGGAST
ncbi:MAG: TetR/AcrR family transcriptional regulator [Deltaproteobacteria bacterium]|nr:TetR/AcrR family transcriptional regulator [Deltaproteobacteria bacterium]